MLAVSDFCCYSCTAGSGVAVTDWSAGEGDLWYEVGDVSVWA